MSHQCFECGCQLVRSSALQRVRDDRHRSHLRFVVLDTCRFQPVHHSDLYVGSFITDEHHAIGLDHSIFSAHFNRELGCAEAKSKKKSVASVSECIALSALMHSVVCAACTKRVRAPAYKLGGSAHGNLMRLPDLFRVDNRLSLRLADVNNKLLFEEILQRANVLESDPLFHDELAEVSCFEPPSVLGLDRCLD
jgi:hypothetical protein